MDKYIRALHVYRTYFPDPPGGLQEAVRQIAISTLPMNVNSKIFALSPNPTPSNLYRPEGEIIRAKSWAAPASCDLGGYSAFKRFSDVCSESDIVHYQFPWPFADVLHTVIRPSIPSMITYQSDVVRQQFLGRLYAPLMWSMLRSMRFVIATSPAYAETSPVLSHPSIREKVRVIPNGIDEETYSKDCDNAVFSRIGLSESEPYFLFVGVLRYYKGLHSLVQAASRIKARIVIAGSGSEQHALKDQVAQSGVRNVIFAGRISDAEKNALLKSCRAFVLPSHLRSEAFGMVLVEASIFNKPLISCEIGTGTSFVNTHEESGFVVPPESPDELANAMNQLLRDEALADKLGAGARARYEKLFSGHALGKAYSNLYQEILEDK